MSLVTPADCDEDEALAAAAAVRARFGAIATAREGDNHTENPRGRYHNQSDFTVGRASGHF